MGWIWNCSGARCKICGWPQPRLNGIVLQPGESFSFWQLVGRPTRRKGYADGMVLTGARSEAGIGGGLCQLANMAHWLVLNSPLTVTELHHHTDALFPDERRTVPFGHRDLGLL